MPAYFTGVYGHKCSPGLVSNDGQFPHMDDVRISITTGPLCRYAEDIGPVMRAIAYKTMPDWKKVINCVAIELRYSITLLLYTLLLYTIHHILNILFFAGRRFQA